MFPQLTVEQQRRVVAGIMEFQGTALAKYATV
jgi:hypothetical protein